MSQHITFRAYADPKRRYWVEVRVFGSQRAMLEDIRRSVGKVDTRVAGQVNAMYVVKKGRALGVFAVLWLNSNHIRERPMEIACHEAVHCAARYFERRGWPKDLEAIDRKGADEACEAAIEERFAYAVGRIARGIARGLFRHKIWVD